MPNKRMLKGNFEAGPSAFCYLLKLSQEYPKHLCRGIWIPAQWKRSFIALFIFRSKPLSRNENYCIYISKGMKVIKHTRICIDKSNRKQT